MLALLWLSQRCLFALRRRGFWSRSAGSTSGLQALVHHLRFGDLQVEREPVETRESERSCAPWLRCICSTVASCAATHSSYLLIGCNVGMSSFVWGFPRDDDKELCALLSNHGYLHVRVPVCIYSRSLRQKASRRSKSCMILTDLRAPRTVLALLLRSAGVTGVPGPCGVPVI